jgi:molybdenum cofactor cytidylyltransferase
MDAIVLAAGLGSRLGGPKALLLFGAPPMPLALAHAMARRDCRRVLVVVRESVGARLAPLAKDMASAVELVVSTAPESDGPAGSIAAASSVLLARASGAGEDPVLVTPVDAVPASRATVTALLSALDAVPEALAAKPAFEGRGGHPVLVRRSVLSRYASPDPPPLRDVLRELGDKCLAVSVADPAIVADLDTPADVERWTGEARRFLGPPV